MYIKKENPFRFSFYPTFCCRQPLCCTFGIFYCFADFLRKTTTDRVPAKANRTRPISRPLPESFSPVFGISGLVSVETGAVVVVVGVAVVVVTEASGVFEVVISIKVVVVLGHGCIGRCCCCGCWCSCCCGCWCCCCCGCWCCCCCGCWCWILKADFKRFVLSFFRQFNAQDSLRFSFV